MGAAITALLHGLAFWWLFVGSTPDVATGPETITLVFIDGPTRSAPERPEIEQVPSVPPPVQPAREVSAEPLRPVAPSTPASAGSVDAPITDSATTLPEATPDSSVGQSASMPPDTSEELSLFDADGSVALPDVVSDRLRAVDQGDLAFDFEQPGFLENGAFMRRPPVLEYEATRFDKDWKPTHDLLTALLEKAVTMLSDEVDVSVGSGRRLRCKISILAMGGSCQMVGGGHVVSLDDPNTLDPEEDAQCAAWWDRIVEAGTQTEWKYTKALYDLHCRKPLEKDLDPPEPDGSSSSS